MAIVNLAHFPIRVLGTYTLYQISIRRDVQNVADESHSRQHFIIERYNNDSRRHSKPVLALRIQFAAVNGSVLWRVELLNTLTEAVINHVAQSHVQP